MLTQREKFGIQSILKALTSEELKSLSITVSKGQIICSSNEECTKAILAIEKSGKEFLHRKVITKKILLQYAYDENLHISYGQSKGDIMKLILKHWAECDEQVVQHTASPSTHTGYPTNQISNTYNLFQMNVTVMSNVYHSPTTVQSSANQSHNALNEDYQFGQTFLNWFFNMLNHSDPVSQGFGPSHFMPQAQLFTNFVSPGNISENSYFNNTDISNCLLELSKNFIFNPNISPEGMRVKSDPHGLKLILICGTIFKDSSLCGTFQQSFGVVKDPGAAQNWKIQVTALKCLEDQDHVEPQFDDHTVLNLERIVVESLEMSLVKV